MPARRGRAQGRPRLLLAALLLAVLGGALGSVAAPAGAAPGPAVTAAPADDRPPAAASPADDAARPTSAASTIRRERPGFARLIAAVVGGGVLLGAVGGLGLYLTRDRRHP